MKTLFTLLLLLTMSMVSAQQVYQIDNAKKAPKTVEQLIGTATLTADKAVYNGTTYKVYKSSRGKLFFVYNNKNNKPSKRYIDTAKDGYVAN